MKADKGTRPPRRVPSREAAPLSVLSRGPVRAGALLCLSGGIYAVTLAGIATAQQASDEGTMAARRPGLDAIDTLGVTADRVAIDLRTLGDLQASSTDRYRTTAQRIAELETRLGRLAERVSSVSGIAAQLPRQVDLPAVPRVASVVAPPRTHATTRASGG